MPPADDHSILSLLAGHQNLATHIAANVVPTGHLLALTKDARVRTHLVDVIDTAQCRHI